MWFRASGFLGPFGFPHPGPPCPAQHLPAVCVLDNHGLWALERNVFCFFFCFFFFFVCVCVSVGGLKSGARRMRISFFGVRCSIAIKMLEVFRPEA